MPQALTAGFSRALLVCSVFLAAAAVVALRAANSRGEASAAEIAPDPAPEPVS